MIRLANLLYLDGRYLIIEEPCSVTVDYSEFDGEAGDVYLASPMRVKVLLPDFVVEQLMKNLEPAKLEVSAEGGSLASASDGAERNTGGER